MPPGGLRYPGAIAAPHTTPALMCARIGPEKPRAGGSHRRVAWCTMKTPYDVLGVAPDADEQTIGNAFRAAAKACHPDLNPEDGAAQQFKQISVARDALKNPEWRAPFPQLPFRRPDAPPPPVLPTARLPPPPPPHPRP